MPGPLDSSSHHHSGPSWPGSGRAVLALIGGSAAVLALNATGLVTSVFGIDTALVVALAGGYPLAARAARALIDRRISYDVTIALAGLVAVAVGQYLAAAEVVLIVLIGDALEHWAMHRSDAAIAGLMSVQPDRASVMRDGREQVIPAVDVQLTDRVIVRGGERVPIDGVVLDGRASVDQSLITGESVPASKAPGAPVYCGSVLEQGALEIRPERVGEDTTLARVGRLVAEAKRRRAPIVRTADRLSRFFLPVLFVSAVLVYVLTGEALRSVAVLLVACSCALVYATPAAFAAALARLARSGILVKGGDVLERLAHVKTVAFDKTGTLTAGRPAVATIVPVTGFSADEVLRFAAAVERRSEHAFGRAIVAETERRGLQIPAADGFTPKPGLGVIAGVGPRQVRVGSVAFMRELPHEGLADLDRLVGQMGAAADTKVVVAVDGRPAGMIVMHDSPRVGAAAAIEALHGLGIEQVLLLTGDDQRTASAVAEEVGIAADGVHAGLLPDDKLRHLREVTGPVLMVGDGVNDAPALAAADVGIAFGRGAADLSAEAAQVVVLDPRLMAVPDLIAFARKTIRRVEFNIMAFAVGVNAAAIVAAGLGYLTPAASAILHQAVSLAVIGGSISLLIEGRALGGARQWTVWRDAALSRLTASAATSIARARVQVDRHRRELARAALAAVALIWACSGVTLVGPGESAVVQRFGRLVNAGLEPGLHVRAPWPLETVTRVPTRRIHVLEVGFRSPVVPPKEPIDLQWDTIHVDGQVQQVADENLVLTGDENLAELYAVVHYVIADPSRYLFATRDPDALVRMMAEGALRRIAAGYSLDALLTTERKALESRWADALRERLTHVGAGVNVLGVHLADVHPPVEVVSAFRSVASAQEEQVMAVNEAEAYSKQQVPIARGTAAARLETAAGYRTSRVGRSEGDAARFLARASPLGGASPLTMFRLQMEALESVLPGKRVVITDDRKGGRRTWIFFGEDGGGLLKLLEKPRGVNDEPD
jgi:HflK protein